MVRRRLTLKRIDPWSVLKFGFVANLTLLGISLLGGAVVWFFVRRLELIEKVCGMALEVGFSSCSVDGGNLFRAGLLLGILGVVILTGLVVFWAFLANLIADLTGGLRFTFVDDTPGAAGRGEVSSAKGAATFRDDTSSSRTGARSTSADNGTGTSSSSSSSSSGSSSSRSGSGAKTGSTSGVSRSGAATRATAGSSRSESSDSGERMFGDRPGSGPRDAR